MFIYVYGQSYICVLVVSCLSPFPFPLSHKQYHTTFGYVKYASIGFDIKIIYSDNIVDRISNEGEISNFRYK